MDFFVWGTLGLLATAFVLVILRSGHRMLTSATGQSQGDPDPTDSYVAYIKAVRSGDREQLAQAPLPEFYSEELLLKALRRTQRHPSLYDLFLERLTQSFILGQFGKLLLKWTRYSGHLEQATAAHNAFLLELSKRPDLRLEYEKLRSVLQAEIREAQASQQHDRGAQSQPVREEPRTRAQLDRERRARYAREDKEYEEAGFCPESYQRQMLRNEYEADIRRLFEQ